MLPPIIDAHHHFIPPAILDDLPAYLTPDLTVRPDGERFHLYRGGVRQMTIDRDFLANVDRQLRDMDADGIATAVLTAAVWGEWMTLPAARVFNRELGALQQRYPGRFVGLAHIPPYGTDGALDELERAIREDGLKGVCITTSFRGKYPDEPEYWPFYAKVNELRIPVFVHAAGCPIDTPQLERYALANTLGRGLDHALVTARVLYSGVLETFPSVRFLMGHLGGAFYGMTKRLIVEAPSRPGNGIPGRDYAGQLRRIWFDTAPSFWQGPNEVAHAIASYGIDRVCFGSDYPAGQSQGVMTDAVRIIERLQLGERELLQICSANAAELFGL